jgi:cytoskeletal protein CcmA (bactofilin family)
MEPVNVNEMSRISAGTTFKGEITTPTDIRVDGTFEGKICSKGRVVVGEKAQIKGDIICQNVDFTGTMHGNFYVKDTLSLNSSSKVKGDLHIKRLQVELDARFDGTCQMISESDFDRLAGAAPAAAPQKPAAAPQPQPVQPK